MLLGVFENGADQVFERWEKSVAFVVAFHERELQAVGYRQKMFVDFSAAADEDRVFILQSLHRFFRRCIRLYVRVSFYPSPRGKNDVAAFRQWPAELLHERFERSPAHEQRMAQRMFLEVFQVFGYMPRQREAVSDDAILFGDGGDEDDFGQGISF